MSNRVSLQYCKMINYYADGSPGEEMWAYRIYDDYDVDYNNCFDSFKELRDTVNMDNVLEYIRDNHSQFEEAIYWKRGLYFCNNWLDVSDQMTEEELEDYNHERLGIL